MVVVSSLPLARAPLRRPKGRAFGEPRAGRGGGGGLRKGNPPEAWRWFDGLGGGSRFGAAGEGGAGHRRPVQSCRFGHEIHRRAVIHRRISAMRH